MNLGNGILHLATIHNHLHVIEALLHLSFPANNQNKDGDTPLHLALRKDSQYIPIIRALIRGGASSYTRNLRGESPQVILAFSDQLMRIPELNQLLSMQTFRQKVRW